MKAIGHNDFGGPGVLQVVNLPDPVPGTGEVRITVKAAAISPTDTLRRAGIRALAQKSHAIAVDIFLEHRHQLLR